MRRMFDAALRRSGFKVLHFADQRFHPFGYTAIWVLGESHFALHTFPEERKTYAELSSCNLQKFCDFVHQKAASFG